MSEDGSFKSLQESISGALVRTTRIAGQIAKQDLAFHKSSSPNVIRQLDRQNARLLSLAQRLASNAVSGTRIRAPVLNNADAVDDNWRSVVDVIDNLLERADACLDEYTGFIKKHAVADGNLSTGNGAKEPTKDLKSYSRDYREGNVLKPQYLFSNPPKNTDSTPFKPLLRSKPHATVPLEESMKPVPSEGDKPKYRNPYETEIRQYKYPASVYVAADSIPYHPFESTTATFVDTPEAVQAMLAELRNAKEIAIDLEHHDKHSYIGLVSLMQISTRDQDWIVDTLQSWREDLQVLNEVFADPGIVKVLHGAFMDIIWLQRDLGLYVVGLFDTFHASSVLNYPGRGLAFLLGKFARFDAQKKYQLADWRIRPLPKELFDYARSDTHFLLYIYDNLRNELVEKSDLSNPGSDLVTAVLEASKEEALQNYEKAPYDTAHGLGANGWYNMIARTPALFNQEQFSVFRAVHQWRDEMARKEDEGVNTVLTRSALFSIATNVPTDMGSLLGCCHPISPLLRLNSQDLLRVVQEAKAAGSTGLDMVAFLSTYPEAAKFSRKAPSFKAKNPASSQSFAIGQLSQKLRKEQQSQRQEVDGSLRGDTSGFWGSVLPSQQQLQATRPPIGTAGTTATITGSNGQPADDYEIRLAIPLPRLTAEVFGNGGATQETEGAANASMNGTFVEPGSRAEHQYLKKEERKATEKNVFTIRDLNRGQKRKAGDGEEGVALDLQPSEDEDVDEKDNASSDVKVEAPNEDGQTTISDKAKAKAAKEARKMQRREEKKQRREEKTRRKAEKKAQQQGQAPSGVSDDMVLVDNGDEESDSSEAKEEAPFDYANAPSVLNARNNDPSRSKGGAGKGPKAFNPYAKSLNAPKGLGRVQKEAVGKSFTFKK
ncbi:exosome nuclease subunit [Agyrium rufum]|nr:exosome nuclease subunit [Agyrium rufum]